MLVNECDFKSNIKESFNYQNLINNTEQSPHLSANSANADSGATGNYLTVSDISYLRDVRQSTLSEQIKVFVANGAPIVSTHHGYLDIPNVGPMIAYLFPSLTGSLLSISQCVNLGLTVTYCLNFVTFYKNNMPIFRGARDRRSGLWMVDLKDISNASQSTFSASLAVKLDSVAEFVAFWHATFGFPALSTFIPAVDKGFIQVPGLTAQKIRKNPPNPTETAAGHLDATRQGQRSTKLVIPDANEIKTTNVSAQVAPELPSSTIWHRISEVKATQTGRYHKDATAAFTVRGVSGALYQQIFYSEDWDYIHVETANSKSASELLDVTQRALKFFAEHGAKHALLRMDNECAADMKEWLRTAGIMLELTPVSAHRTNRAERAIRTWKNHFIAMLAGIDPECPLALWEDFIEQAELTLNLLRQSPCNSILSAYEGLRGRFDLNRTPIAPVGTKVMVHDTPEKRGSWQAHGQLGFYTGRALSHYRCYSVWIPATRGRRISDCLSWHPIKLKMPGSSPLEELTAAIDEVQRAINKLSDNAGYVHIKQPLSTVSDILSHQLRTMRDLFQPPPPPPPPPSTVPQATQGPQGIWPRAQVLGPQAPLQRVNTPQALTDPATTVTPACNQGTQVPAAHPGVRAHVTPAGRLPAQTEIGATSPDLSLQTPTTSQFQRVKKQTRKQSKAKPDNSSNIVPSVTPSQVVVSVNSQQVIALPARSKSKNSYWPLTASEIKKLPQATIKRIGMKFLDDKDPTDVCTGVVDSVVRHKQSHKLAFKYWDHNVHTSAPKAAKDFEYLNVKYALEDCSWAKALSVASLVAASVLCEQTFLNRGPTRNSIKKAKQRERPWWVLRANAANKTTGVDKLSDLLPSKDSYSETIPEKQPISKTPRTWRKDTDAYLLHIEKLLNSAEDEHQPQFYRDLFAYTAQDMNVDGSPLTSSSALRGPDKERWLEAHGEEIERLIESKTAKPIDRLEMPRDRKASYYNPQLKIKHKADGIQYRVRGTIGGDQIDYPGVTAAFTAGLETIRILLNATVSEGARFFTADIKDFYLGTPLPRKEYMRVPIKHIPLKIQKKYNMEPLIYNGYILMEISNTIYGLPQAGRLSQERLVSHLATFGYKQCSNTPCLFVHESNGIAFTLVVDDFLVKYKNQGAAEHLLAALRELYTITTDFATTQKYVGITLFHNLTTNTIDMSMPGYVQKALLRFKRKYTVGADSPIIYVPPRYGKYQQEIHPDAPSVPLTAAEKLELQEIVGVFLFYARAVDPTMITAINKIGSRQAKPTSLIKKEIERFLQYASSHPDATLRIRASDMKLVCHSDGSYNSESEARSRAGSLLFLGDCADGEAPNAPIAYISVIISTVVASATETEYAALFITGQAATCVVNTLADLGYPQGPVEIFCDNKCAVGIAHNTLNLKRAKTIDMRYHWIRDQVKQRKFTVTRKPGNLNLADFFTKAHPVHHHVTMRNMYVATDRNQEVQQQRVDSSEGVLIHEVAISDHIPEQ